MDSEVAADEPVSVAVVRAVSNAESRDPRSLPPLADVVDPDALDSLFAARSDGGDGGPGRVTFAFSDSLVTVDGDGRVAVEPHARVATA